MPGLAHTRRQATSLSSTNDTLCSLSSTRSWAKVSGTSKKTRELRMTKDTRTYSEESIRSNCKLGKSKDKKNIKFILISYSPRTQKITTKSRNNSTIPIRHTTTFTVKLSRFDITKRENSNIKRNAVGQFQKVSPLFQFDFAKLY